MADPNTYRWRGQTLDLRETLAPPGTEGPLAAESLALNDPYSAASSHLYYGGDRDAAEAERTAQMEAALRAQGRGIGIDTRQTGASSADALRFGNELAARAAGRDYVGYGDRRRALGPTLAQQDLARGFAQSDALARSGAAGARGGFAARAAATRAAHGLMAGNAQQQAVASSRLANAERMQAIEALARHGSALRDAEQGLAFGRAGLDAKARAINDAETARREAMGMDVAKLGMQGELARQQERTDFLRQLYGQQARGEQARVAAETRDVNTALGGASAAVSAAGQISQRYGGDTATTPPKKKPYDPYDPGY